MTSVAPTLRRTTTVQVAGTAGGVGTTTVAALLFAALSQDVLGAPQLHDHAAGELGLRLPEGDDVRLVNPGLGAARLWSPRCAAWSGSPIRTLCWCW